MSKDKPFRELQFSSAQLVIVFLAILVLGVFIFLLGISVGKKQAQLAAGTGLAPSLKVETLAPQPPAAATAEVTKPAPADKAPDSKPAEKPSERPADKPADKTSAATPAEPKAKPAETKTEAPAPAKPKPADVKKPAAKADNASRAQYYVQVGAVTDKPSARTFADKLEKLGFPAAVFEPLPTDKRSVFRVRVGPFNVKAEAEDVQDKVAEALKKKKTDFFIVRD